MFGSPARPMSIRVAGPGRARHAGPPALHPEGRRRRGDARLSSTGPGVYSRQRRGAERHPARRRPRARGRLHHPQSGRDRPGRRRSGGPRRSGVGGGVLLGELRQDSDAAVIQADLTSVELGSIAPDLRGRVTGRVSLRGVGRRPVGLGQRHPGPAPQHRRAARPGRRRDGQRRRWSTTRCASRPRPPTTDAVRATRRS